MIATFRSLTTENALPTGTLIPRRRMVPEWELVGIFNTIEAADPLLRRLRADGREAHLTLVCGLSVFARTVKRDLTNDNPVAKPHRSMRVLPA